MDEKTESNSKLIAMHDLHFYSDAWMSAITKPSLGAALGKMIGPNVEVHHSTMVRAPQNRVFLLRILLTFCVTSRDSTSSHPRPATRSICTRTNHFTPVRAHKQTADCWGRLFDTLLLITMQTKTCATPAHWFTSTTPTTRTVRSASSMAHTGAI